MDPNVLIRLCAFAYHRAASRPNWPGVRMLYRLRKRVTVFGATNENRHQTGTTTTPLSNCWDDQRPVRRNANLSFSRTRSGVVIDARALFADVALSKGSFSMSQSLTPASVAHTSATPHTAGTGAVRLGPPLNALIEGTSAPSRIEQGTRSWWRSRTAIIDWARRILCSRLCPPDLSNLPS